MLVSEDDFHKLLDADPDDWQTRLVFADWLQEREDPRAEGMRALGMLRVRPMPYTSVYRSYPFGRTDWIWTFATNTAVVSDVRGYTGPLDDAPAGKKFGLPAAWMKLVIGDTERWWTPPELTRRDAEDKVAHAFSLIPPGARKKITRGRR